MNEKLIKTNQEELMPEQKGPVQTNHACPRSDRVGTQVRKRPDVTMEMEGRVWC